MAKKLYRVHFMGYYGYDVDVLAESKEEAEEIAEPVFEEADEKDFWFESNGTDCWEEKPYECASAYEEVGDETVEKTYTNGEWK